MRSLKECYEIAKQYHKYWVEESSEDYSHYMCYAAERAKWNGKLSREEYEMLFSDITSLVRAIDSRSSSLGHALEQIGVLSASYSCTEVIHNVIKEFWDNCIDKMENQDG